jgi:hypothetical protein
MLLDMLAMISHNSFPNSFNQQCLSTIQTVHTEISNGTNSRWFKIEYVNQTTPEIAISFDWDHQRAQNIYNSPVFRAYIASKLLKDCPVRRVVGYGLSFEYGSGIDIWFGYRTRNQQLIELNLCDTMTYPVFCEDL